MSDRNPVEFTVVRFEGSADGLRFEALEGEVPFGADLPVEGRERERGKATRRQVRVRSTILTPGSELGSAQSRGGTDHELL